MISATQILLTGRISVVGISRYEFTERLQPQMGPLTVSQIMKDRERQAYFW
jgi:hypothetical protein